MDSTFAALRPGLFLCNPACINEETLPEIFKQWEVIYSPPTENTGRHDADYLSRSIDNRWMETNVFSISPHAVVVDQDQSVLIKVLEKHGLDFVPLKLRHSRLMGWAFHCVILDTRRKGRLESNFD